MSRKLQTIQALKAKLIKMQRKLDDVSQHKQSNYQQKQSININTDTDTYVNTITDYNSTPLSRNTPQNQNWKNPTFWGNNPIFGKQSHNEVQSIGKWKKQGRRCREYKRELSPKLKDMQKQTDTQYYQDIQNKGQSQSYSQSRSQSPSPIKSSKGNQTKYFTSKRYEHSYHGFAQRQTPRFEKIRTYDAKTLTEILNLSNSPKNTGKKMVKKPTNILTQNQQSESSGYFFGENQRSISPKSHYSGKKNKSPYMRQVLSPSTQNKARSPCKSNKKHFTRYFQQTFHRNWL